MKCPKCYFIGFDQGQRCKNCGYQFSFSAENASYELPLKTGDEPLGPLADFPIETPEPAQAASGAGTGDLPLFGLRGDDDDRPLVSVPAAPRTPVAVRKSSPAVRPAPARKPHVDEPTLDLKPERESSVHARGVSGRDAAASVEAATKPPPGSLETSGASGGARLGAAVIDIGLMLAIDAAVLYFTLKICGLALADWRMIPPAPFLAFVAMLNGGYLAASTAASGQTLGKAVAGIKVVTADGDAATDRVRLGQAILRTVGYLVSVFPAGLGFLPAFIGAERRALHDRLAHTRVVSV